jgi:hypothetical protein
VKPRAGAAYDPQAQRRTLTCSRLTSHTTPDDSLLRARSTGAADAFTGRLLGILDAVTAEGGPRQPLTLGVHRSDYMVDRGPDVSGRR